MKKLIPTFAVLVATSLPLVVHGADSAVLKIIGLITPAACLPTFTGGDTIDYGNIPGASLSSISANPLPRKSTQLSIACDMPLKFAVQAKDDRPGTAIDTLETYPGFTPNTKYGLGTASDGSRIGAYSMQIERTTSDAGEAVLLLGNADGTGWRRFGGGLRHTGELTAFGLGAGALEPAGHQLVTLDIGISTTIDSGSNLPLSEEIPLDGQSTFELVYL